MGLYIARRGLSSLPVPVIVVTVVFFLFQLIPGDPARALLGPDVVEEVRRELELDQPILIQYVTYLRRLFHGDLGKSISTRRPVSQELTAPFWNTVKLAIVSIGFAIPHRVLLGTIAVVH